MTTKSEIIDAVASALGQPKGTTKDIVDGAFGYVANALVAGEKVQIAGLGVFEVKATAARLGRNPATGEPVNIPAGKKISFKPAADLKAKL